MKPVYVFVFMAGFISFPLAKDVFKKPPLLEKKVSATSKPAVEKPAAKTIRMKVTAYCPCKKCCGACSDGKTSTGKNAYKTRGVAADPKLLPYRTRLNIPGIGILPVDDTGGAMRQDAKKGICHIDVRFPSHQEALNFGVKWLDVEILN